jgi:hypothetical protein
MELKVESWKLKINSRDRGRNGAGGNYFEETGEFFVYLRSILME